MRNTLTTCLWFDGRAEEAVRFYAGVFKGVKIGDIARFTEEGREIHRQEPGSAMTVEWEMFGQRFVGLNGGPQFPFTEAVSFQIDCDTQDEIDFYWENLTSGGGKPGNCGWLKDKFGVSWQVVYTGLTQMMKGKDPESVRRATAAMLKMNKLDVAALEKAYGG
jgi:predicted 3-demethylubiquinone-9 3-methyltransferase (glyoxalase superfamily)